MALLETELRNISTLVILFHYHCVSDKESEFYYSETGTISLNV